MFDRVVVHPRTQAQIDAFIHNPGHALLLTGGDGIGKRCVAYAIIENVLGIPFGHLETYPYFTSVGDDGESISIDAIRQLQHTTNLRTPGKGQLRRAIVVEHANRLTKEAQNALLKLLEEPPKDTVYVLTANTSSTLLPTVLSRVQSIAVHVPPADAVCKYFSAINDYTDAVVEKAYLLSGGLPGLMHALLQGDSGEHPLISAINSAKNILKQPQFERLAIVDALSKRKDDATRVVQALQHIAHAGLRQAAKKQDSSKLQQWYRVLKVSTSANDSLRQNANTKLVLTDLMISL